MLPSKAESDDEGAVELGELVGPQLAAATHQDLFRQREEVVAVGGAVMIQSLGGTELDLGHMAMEGAGHEHADQRPQQRDGARPGGDDHWVSANARDLSVPDLPPCDQRSLAARHAATEKAASSATTSSPVKSGWP